MHELKAFFRPTRLEEAFSFLYEFGEKAQVLAGGTSLVLSQSSKIEALIDLHGLGLDSIQRGNEEYTIGSMATIASLRTFLEKQPPGALSDAASVLGSHVLQNHITVGGNSIMVYTWSDLPVALLCLGAAFVLEKGQGAPPREISAADFFAKPPTRIIGDQEILTKVKLPTPAADAGSAFLKFRLNENDQALASSAVQLQLSEKGSIQKVQIIAGAVRGLPQALVKSAAHLQGHVPESALFREAAKMAAEEANVVTDYKATEEYRRNILEVLVDDALQIAFKRAGGAR